jgi:hypothetical protein
MSLQSEDYEIFEVQPSSIQKEHATLCPDAMPARLFYSGLPSWSTRGKVAHHTHHSRYASKRAFQLCINSFMISSLLCPPSV